MNNIIIIGGGAAGIFAAIGAAKVGANITIIERNNILGRKLRITGKGRCNITNDGDIDTFLKNFTKNKNFLYSPFYAFSNEDLINLLAEIGIKTKVERGGRVFPESDSAVDVVKRLETYLRKNNIKILYNSRVKALQQHNNKISGVVLEDTTLAADKVILATGGVSYPRTGSDGDGYRLAQSMGHSVTKIVPALVPLETKEEWVKSLTGLSLKNVTLSATIKDKTIKEFGEMLFTHFGISGPIVLTLSKEIIQAKDEGNLKKLEINLKPALDIQKLENRVSRDLQKYSNKQLKNSLMELLPKALIEIVIELSKIDPNKFCHQITKEERKRLVYILQHLPLTITKSRPIDEAIVTSGGITIKEISPKTMESKIIEGLYFAGEIIDIDANTGGFNLQAAFSTGFLAGKYAAENI